MKTKFISSPLYLLIILISIIFLAEFLVMYILPFILPHDVSSFVENIVDGALLSAIVAPILWRIVVVPLRGDIYQSQKRSQIIVDAAMNGIISLDENGNIVSVNPAVLSILELTRKELIGTDFRQIFPKFEISNTENMDKIEFIYKTKLGIEKNLKPMTSLVF